MWNQFSWLLIRAHLISTYADRMGISRAFALASPVLGTMIFKIPFLKTARTF